MLGQNENIRFDHITITEGLAQNTVSCILKDTRGFMWFGTQGGLNRYDGRSFIIYDDFSIEVENGKFGNVINDICEDNEGNIWIGTERGLIKFNAGNESFRSITDYFKVEGVQVICKDRGRLLWVGSGEKIFVIDPHREKCVKDGKTDIVLDLESPVRSISIGDITYLWVGTEKGLFKVDSKNISEPYVLAGKKDRSIMSIYRDKDNYVWVCTEDGMLLKYNDEYNSFQPFYKNRNRIALSAICEDEKQRLWLGFNGDGIAIFSKDNGKAFRLESNFSDKRSLNDNYVQTILNDEAGTIWIGTLSGGVNKYNRKKEKFKTYFNVPGTMNSLSENSVFSIFEDKDSFIWIGTYSGNLDKFSPKEKNFESLTHDSFVHRLILDIVEDGNGDLWIGTSIGGLFHCIDKKNGKYEQIENSEVLGKKRVRVLENDQDGIHIWIGTEEKGIVQFTPETKRFGKRFAAAEDNGLSSNNIYSIYADEEDKNILWVGTAKGLDKVDKDSGLIVLLKKSDNKDRKIFSIVPAFASSGNTLWLGTDSGLCKIDKRNNRIIRTFTIQDGLPNNFVYGILCDNSGYFWFSTNNGISKFNTERERVEKNFYEEDGLQANEFNSGAYFKSKSGHMYFGGIRGLSVFHPDEIEIDKAIPPVYFTILKVGDDEIKTGVASSDGELLLPESITVTKEIILDYQKQPFLLEFSALDFNVPQRIRYKYSLMKEDAQVIVAGDRVLDNAFTFLNLNIGRYIFKVWSSNSDGHFDISKQKPAEIRIIIKRKFTDILRPLIIPLSVIIITSILLIAMFYVFFKGQARRRVRKLELIGSAINDVSRQENIEGVVSHMLDYIVYGLGFGYGTISLIDFFDSTISTVLGKTRDPLLVNPNKWISGDKYRLNEINILIEVVKEKRAKEIFGPEIDIEKDKRFDKKIFKEHVHKDLIRIFVPIEYLVKESNIKGYKDQLVLGVVEAGFHRFMQPYIPKEMKVILKLYISYCAPLFYRAILRHEKQAVEDLLNNSSGIEHHTEYLEKILRDAVELVRGDKGDISFFSFNDNKININDNSIFCKINSEADRKLIKKGNKISKRKGIVRHTADTNHYYYSGSVKKDDYYIEEFEDVNSELAVPIRYSERVIGVLNIYSTELNFFDDRKANIIQAIADEAGKVYQNKKVNHTIKNLVMPFHLFTGIEKIYELIISNIRDYFITEFVSVWERTEEREKRYRLLNACNKLKEGYREFGLKYLKTDILASNSGEIQLISFEDNNQLNSGFDEFAKSYDFKTMILVPIFVEKQVYGFINIFSKRLIPSLFVVDKTFLNLVAIKGAISAQYEKLITTFMEVSNVLPTENFDRILQYIADNASKILYADPVILFRYDPNQSIFNAKISGSLVYPKLKKIINFDEREPDHLALYIIKNGSVWFQNSNFYKTYIKDKKRKRKGIYFDDDFWTREKIKSSVGIRLEHNDEPIGVMFFNYREEQTFDKDTKRFIEAFSSLASSAIVNARYLDLIERQKIKLEQQKAELQIQTEKLQFEYEDIYNKMTEMLPRATRTSFYLILSGVNHDMRNYLLRMKEAILNIRDSSSSWKFSKKEKNDIDVRIKDIDRNIRNVTNLLELFDFKNSGKEQIKINDLIEELTFFFKTRESEEITFDTKKLKTGIPIIECNKAELSMIIYNLLSNSVYAIVDKEKPNGEIKIATDFKGNEYVIVVEDNGVGIDNGDIPNIYEAGFTTREDGLGIGLYFVNETLREHFSGKIECESKYGHWTRFVVRIPKSVNYKEDE